MYWSNFLLKKYIKNGQKIDYRSTQPVSTHTKNLPILTQIIFITTQVQLYFQNLITLLQKDWINSL